MPLELSRRTVLRGLGAGIALPWLEAMGPLTAWADGATKPEQAAPNRMAFLYVPNGKNMADWTPASEGTSYELPHILKPLEAVRSKFSILTGLTADKCGAWRWRRRSRTGARSVSHRCPATQDGRHGHQNRHVGRSSRSGTHWRQDTLAVSRNRHRSGRDGRQLRFRVLVRVLVHDVMAIGNATAAERSQSEAGLRATFQFSA